MLARHAQAGPRLLAPAHLVQANSVLEALEHRLAVVGVDIALTVSRCRSGSGMRISPAPALAAMRDAMITVDNVRGDLFAVSFVQRLMTSARVVLRRDIGHAEVAPYLLKQAHAFQIAVDGIGVTGDKENGQIPAYAA